MNYEKIRFSVFNLAICDSESRRHLAAVSLHVFDGHFGAIFGDVFAVSFSRGSLGFILCHKECYTVCINTVIPSYTVMWFQGQSFRRFSGGYFSKLFSFESAYYLTGPYNL